jgi:ribosomal protein L11 methylase PrmA
MPASDGGLEADPRPGAAHTSADADGSRADAGDVPDNPNLGVDAGAPDALGPASNARHPASSRHPASFRDPDGFVFVRDGVFYRQVTQTGRRAYDSLRESGLHDELVGDGLLLADAEVEPDLAPQLDAYRVLRPQQLPFVSYPYEWSFSQLRDAALLTLDAERRALARGLSLKDASAYNVQYVDGRSVLIDSLSFEPYVEGEPWIAYRQFCQHFLAPLALMSRVDVRLGGLLERHIDGIPLDLAASLLPLRTRLSVGLGVHIHAHAWSSRRHERDGEAGRGSEVRSAKAARVSLRERRNLVDSLRDAVKGCSLRSMQTAWSDYYERTNYSDEAMAAKVAAVTGFVERVGPSVVWDLGANIGRFSRIAAERGALAVAWDADPIAVDACYRMSRDEPVARLLPLLVDLTNPSPDLGWLASERAGFFTRATPGPGRSAPDLVLALGLIHHLAIGNNVPLQGVADLLARLGRHAVVEWIPKEDSQVGRLLASRRDIFPDYTWDGFRRAFQRRFRFAESAPVSGSVRRLELLERID